MTHDKAAGHLGVELIRKIAEAADGGSLQPLGELADFMTAAGLVSHSRGQLISSFWYKTTLQHSSRKKGELDKYVLLGRRLCDEGYCTDRDMEAGICSTLFAVGVEQGWLEASLYDLMVSLLPARSEARLLISEIKRVDIQ